GASSWLSSPGRAFSSGTAEASNRCPAVRPCFLSHYVSHAPDLAHGLQCRATWVQSGTSRTEVHPAVVRRMREALMSEPAGGGMRRTDDPRPSRDRALRPS